jgi:hypothetical protein
MVLTHHVVRHCCLCDRSWNRATFIFSISGYRPSLTHITCNEIILTYGRLVYGAEGLLWSDLVKTNIKMISINLLVPMLCCWLEEDKMVLLSWLYLFTVLFTSISFYHDILLDTNRILAMYCLLLVDNIYFQIIDEK